MNALLKRSLFTAVSASLFLFLYSVAFNNNTLGKWSSWSTVLPSQYPLDTSKDVKSAESQADFSYVSEKPPKITIIAIWTIKANSTPAYMPYFFQSVEENPQVDLLFVQVDMLGHGCPTQSSAPNVKVCKTQFKNATAA